MYEIETEVVKHVHSNPFVPGDVAIGTTGAETNRTFDVLDVDKNMIKIKIRPLVKPFNAEPRWVPWSNYFKPEQKAGTRRKDE